MPTIEELLALPKEEREQLFNVLKESIETTTDDTKLEVDDNHVEQKVVVEETVVVEENQLEGGKADNLSLEDIATKHNVTVEFLNAELEKAIQVELEHTDDPEKAKEIALDHLSEQADYYEKLKAVETTTEPVINYDEKIQEVVKTFDEKFETLIEKFGEQLGGRDKLIGELKSEIEELKRTAPTKAAPPIITQDNLNTPKEQAKEQTRNSWRNSPSADYVKFSK